MEIPVIPVEQWLALQCRNRERWITYARGDDLGAVLAAGREKSAMLPGMGPWRAVRVTIEVLIDFSKSDPQGVLALPDGSAEVTFEI